MLEFDNSFLPLRRFELARRLLLHSFVLTDEMLKELSDHRELSRGMCLAYERLLEEVVSQKTRGQLLPEHIALPVVDARAGLITYTTYSTGDTEIVADLRNYTLQMRRPTKAIDPSDPLRTALAVLTGYLQSPPSEWGPKPAGLADPRDSARPRLVELVGEAEAQRMIVSYFPHWRAWSLEDELAARQTEAEQLLAQRSRFHRDLTRR